MGKKWYDDWTIIKTIAGVFTVELPNAKAKRKSIVIKGKYTRKHIEWLISFLMCALDELTSRGKEMVICAAVKTTAGKVFRGHRHGDCMHTIKRAGLKVSGSASAQGFITSKNRYVTREQGRKIQDAAGIPSASPEGYMPGTLFSEDLY